MDTRQKHGVPDPKDRRSEGPVPEIYPVVDTDLARDNLENDLPYADREDLEFDPDDDGLGEDF